jgi:hypothetical protein
LLTYGNVPSHPRRARIYSASDAFVREAADPLAAIAAASDAGTVRGGAVMPNAKNVPLRLALVLGLGAACAPPARALPRQVTGGRCDDGVLLLFDPGLPVRARRSLPAVTQQLSGSEERIVEVVCGAGEEDEACRARARVVARRAHPQASLAIVVDSSEKIVRALLRIDAHAEERDFDSLAALGEYLESLRSDHDDAVALRVLLVPKPGSPRVAAVRAELDQVTTRKSELRYEIVLAAPLADSPDALARVIGHAARAGLDLRNWQREDRGDVRIEIACSLPSEP